jgi:uncharacterized protein (DUF1330 family)
MASVSVVQAELEMLKGDKKALMQKYSEQQQAIIKKYGGNFTDVPPDNNGEYAELQSRIQILHGML